MRVNRLKKLIAVVIASVLVLSGCSGSDRKEAVNGTSGMVWNVSGVPERADRINPDTSCYSLVTGQDVFAENYAIYHTKDGQLMVFDTASGVSIPYCFSPNCQHEKNNNIDSKTTGCLSHCYAMNTLSLRDDGSFFFSSPILYRADQMGYNRKTVVKVKDAVAVASVLVEYYTTDDLFLSYILTNEAVPDGREDGGWIIGDHLDKREAGVYRISLNDGKTSYVYQEKGLYDATIVSMHVDEGRLFFVVDGFDIPFAELPAEEPEAYNKALAEHKQWSVYEYRISDGKTRLIKQYKGLGGAFFGDGYYVVTSGSQGGEVTICDTNGEAIRELSFPVESCPFFHSNRYLFYQYYDNESAECAYGMYDITEESILKEVKTTTPLGQWIAAAGDSYYLSGENLWYINAEDFWNEKWDRGVKLR